MNGFDYVFALAAGLIDRLAIASERRKARTRRTHSCNERVNPAFIPRNDGVEQALDAAIEYRDSSQFAELTTVLSGPYEDQAVYADYANAPHADERVFCTFCGT